MILHCSCFFFFGCLERNRGELPKEHLISSGSDLAVRACFYKPQCRPVCAIGMQSLAEEYPYISNPLGNPAGSRNLGPD